MAEEPLLCSQLQQWDPMRDTTAMPAKEATTGYSFQTPLKHPWRPVMGYEEVEVTPMPSQPITNALVDPCYTPQGMVTEPLRFPNLVTGFDRSPEHAARAALYTRYTPYEWNQNSIQNYNASDSKRNFSERMRNDIGRLMRETDETVKQGQRDAGRRLGERLTDTTYWRNEVNTELERQVSTIEELHNAKLQLERAIAGLEGPLHICQECLYHREKRQGVELVHDQVEQSLLKEVDIIRRSIINLKAMLDKVNQQLKNCRGAQHELEVDMRHKENALGIDTMCHQLNNYSKGIHYYAGIEKYDPTVSNPASWAEACARTVQRSQGERARAAQLISDVENLINVVAAEVWDQWSNSNNSYTRKIAETLEVKTRIQLHLHKVQQELFEVEKSIEMLNKAILDKSGPLKVAHTRLQARTNRPSLELCRDEAHTRIVREVIDIRDAIDQLRQRLTTAEGNHQTLLGVRASLETELRNKTNAIFIDRDQCMGLRRGYPVTAMIKT